MLEVKTLEHRGVGLHVVCVSHPGFFLIESGGGVDEALFPRIRGTEFLRFLDVLAALFHFFVVGEFPKLVIQGHGFSPVRDGALWFACGRIGKSLPGFRVLEGVQERDAFFDYGLHFRTATRRELYVTKLIGRRCGQGIRLKGRRLKSEKEEQPDGRSVPAAMAHDVSPFVASDSTSGDCLGGDKPFGGEASRRLDADSAWRIQWEWSGTSKQVRVRKLFEPMTNL